MSTALQDTRLDSLWMPFTANKQFKRRPRMLASAQGMFYTSTDGREVLDGTAGLWCVGAGHGRREITEAVSRQVAQMEYAPGFQMGHPLAFDLADELVKHTPEHLNHVFFTNSGSESVDTALKIALAYHRSRGEGQRTRFIGREKGYHGVGFGGISVGGIANNRRAFGAWVPADHLPHTLNLEHNAFSRGVPAWGAHLADELEDIVALHGADTIAAVIVEPVAGSAGVILPPKGYLERLREICDKHGLLLIFDEVITGFGRLGAPFAADYFGVEPDLITSAKMITNAAVPMGAVFTRDKIYQSVVEQGPEVIELFHGYTYSGHPVACAAGMATLEIYRKEGLFTRASEMAPIWEDALHGLRDCPHVKDVRNLGLMGAIELEPRPGAPGARAYEALVDAFEHGLLLRFTGDIIALSPPLIAEREHIERIATTLSEVLGRIA